MLCYDHPLNFITCEFQFGVHNNRSKSKAIKQIFIKFIMNALRGYFQVYLSLFEYNVMSIRNPQLLSIFLTE